MTPLTERALALIARQKSLPVENVQLDQTLDDLQFDSLDKVTLLFEIEEEFHLEISDAELASLHTVGDIVRGIEQKAPAAKVDE